MKVGIMSMQRIVNHGSFMQAYALKKIIEELGHEVVFVDYHIGLTIDKKGDLKRQLRHYMGESSIGTIYRRYRRSNNSQNKSELECKYEECLPMLGISEKRNYRARVDVLVIGSDEVFNCVQMNPDVGYSPELFGYKCRAQKSITYAASFGSAKLDDLYRYKINKEISKFLCKIKRISVRDENSREIVSKLCGIEPEVHLDPVLVGNVEKNIAEKRMKFKYIAVYGYVNRFSEEESKVVCEFAKKENLKLVSLYGFQPFCDQNIACRPDEILAYIKSAEYVITDTFHGVIFSIINKKQFAVFVRSSDSPVASNQEKLQDLLIRLQLQSQQVTNLNDLSSILHQPINYVKVEKIRVQQRKRTMEYLKEELR